jgi:cytochrome c-type biogenesis protein CcmH
MDFWIVVTVLTVAIVAILIRPLLAKATTAGGERLYDAEVYRDQLDELERDAASGLISAGEANYAKAEIGRRLIAASEGGEAEAGLLVPKRSKLSLLAMVVVVLLVPLTGFGLYLKTGSPDLPDEPLAERMANPDGDIALLIAKVEQQLAANPDDGAGWNLLAPIYFRNGRLDDAANAWRNAIRTLGPTAERLSNLGEALVASQQGIINDEAEKNFRDAVALDKNNFKARFYVALALEQEGLKDKALAGYNSIVADSPKDAPWLQLVNEHIAMVSGTAPAQVATPQAPVNPDAPGNPTAADVDAASQMSSGDRMQMIRGMVEGLDAKLQADPNNFEGWMRLVRSYAMLKDDAKAAEALKRALAAFAPETPQGKQLLDLASQLGMKGPAQ